MINNGIEDILISRDYNKKKKKNKGFVVVFFILLILLAGCAGAYWYLLRDSVSSKELFVQNVSKININKLLNNEIYTNLISRMQSESSQINSSINFTTDIESEELQDIDITKFKLDVSNSNDVVNNKNYNEAVLNYSGNEVFKLDLITSENEIALASDEILNQYVGVHIDKIKDVFGIDIDIDKINELKSMENIDLSEDELNKYMKKYFEVILNNISEDKFGVQENIAIENATEDVEVTNYSVTLTQEELNNVLIKTLEEIKTDDEIINKLVLISEENDTVTQENPVITPTEIQNENSAEITEENSSEGQVENQIEEENISEVPVENEEQDGNSQIETNNPEENLQTDIPVVKINPVGTIVGTQGENNAEDIAESQSSENPEVTVQSVEEESENIDTQENTKTIDATNIDELIEKENDYKKHLINIMFGKKVNLTKEELKTLIDEIIKKVENISGNGIKINVYASAENVEKINIVLPNDNILDIDFFPDNNSKINANQSYIKVTYLYENKVEENIEKNGFALEVKKEQSNASTAINAIYSFIENEKINKKIKLDLKTEGTLNSKELKNDIVVTISTNKSETQVVIDNAIEFKEVTDLPGLNAENCIYLDMLPEAERQNLLDTIKTQITTLYTNKKENLNFIDTNTYSQETLENQNSNPIQTENQTQTSTVTREEAKNVLITKVSNMMQEAIDRNEEFTIQNLAGLTIDGYKVSAAVTSEAALIVVDVYKFNIDTSFTLTDVE